MSLVFCYGTLLSGEPNSSLLERAKLVGPAMTRPEFRMFSNGWFPYTVRVLNLAKDDPDYHKTRLWSGYAVKGEVYEVDSATLSQLDRLEGVPHHYRRETIEVNLGGKWRAVDIYLYYGDTSRLEEIENGDWKAREGQTNG